MVALAPVSLKRHDGIYVEPAALGAQLFLWVHGNPNSPAEELFSDATVVNDWSPSPEDWSLTRREIEQQRNLRNLAYMYGTGTPAEARQPATSLLRYSELLPESVAAVHQRFVADPTQVSDAELLSAFKEIAVVTEGVA